jgi:hypothetical protein
MKRVEREKQLQVKKIILGEKLPFLYTHQKILSYTQQ